MDKTLLPLLSVTYSLASRRIEAMIVSDTTYQSVEEIGRYYLITGYGKPAYAGRQVMYFS